MQDTVEAVFYLVLFFETMLISQIRIKQRGLEKFTVESFLTSISQKNVSFIS